MAKTVLKEIIIMLLLCLVIILALGILLYEYVPMTKTIPNPVSYSTPSEVKKELANSSDIDESQIIMTYEVDATDLNNYTSIQDYKPGKANPFSSYEPTTSGSTSTNGTSTTTANSYTTDTQTGNNQVQDNGTSTSNVNNNPVASSTQSTPSAPVSTSEPTTTTQTSQDTNTSGGHFFQDKGTK